MIKNVVIAVITLVLFVQAEVEAKQPQLLLEAKFDNYRLSANRAVGDPQAEALGNIKFKPGVKGSAAEFGDKSAVKFKARGNYSPDAGTVELHFKLYPVTTEYRRMLFTLYSNDAERIYVRQCTKDSIQVFLRGFKGGGGLNIPFSDKPAGSWHHIAFCWKINDKVTNVKVYLDGIKKADEDIAMVFPDFESGHITIGGYYNGMLPLYGLIDEVKIYDDVVYTDENCPQFFKYPPVAPLEKKLAEIKGNLPFVGNTVQREAAESKYQQLSDKLGKLKAGDFPKESYLKAFSEIENGIKGLFDSYISAAIWWKNKPAATGDFDAVPVSPMRKINNSWSQVPEQQTQVNLFSAGHEWQIAQLVILPRFKEVRNCRIEAGDLKGENGILQSSNIEFFRVGVVTQSTDPQQRVWADPVYPLPKAFDVKPEKVQAVWMQIYVPAGTAPGQYKGSVTVEANNHKLSIPVSVTVYDFSLPVTPRLKTAFGFARFNTYNALKLTPVYLENMLKHKVSPKALWRHGIYNRYFLAPKLIKTTGGDWKMDFSDYDRQLDQLLPLGLNTIMVGHRAWDGNARSHAKNQALATSAFPYYDEKTGQDEILSFPVLSPEAEKMSKFIVKNWYGHLKKRKLEHMAYTYVADEPYSYMMSLVNTLCGWVKQVEPALPNMTTHVPDRNCKNVDIWCPIITELTAGSAKASRQLWTYVCCAPLSPNPNFFINQTAVENRLPFWVGYKYGATGFLYYETARSLTLKHRGDSWESLAWAGQPDTEGDGFLVYPGENGPVNSIRFEYVRQGIQDIEYFMMLKDLAAKLPAESPVKKQAEQLLIIPDSLIKSSAEYSKDWNLFAEHKRQVGAMIVKVLKTIESK